jgi:hypothetical protein
VNVITPHLSVRELEAPSVVCVNHSQSRAAVAATTKASNLFFADVMFVDQSPEERHLGLSTTHETELSDNLLVYSLVDSCEVAHRRDIAWPAYHSKALTTIEKLAQPLQRCGRAIPRTRTKEYLTTGPADACFGPQGVTCRLSHMQYR